MGNGKKMVAKLAKGIADNALKRDANQTSCAILYQPRVPLGLNRFKKGKA